MKKNYSDWGELCHPLKKTLLIMRIAIVLLLAGFLQTHANDVYAQKARLSVSFTNTQLAKVLDQIEKESEFYFLYNEKLIDANRHISIDVKDERIDDVLKMLFTGTNVEYTITGRKIILAPSDINENQQAIRKVSGRVSDASGATLPGVSVVQKGTNNGVITDINGNYSLSNIPENATLQFSFVGMKMQEIMIAGKTSINVILTEETIGIEEVVAIGYGTIKKKDLTGSVGSVQNKEIKDLASTRIEQALSGKTAGVQVKAVSGEPGIAPQIRIRGIGSISAGVDPLYVVDGFPTDNLQMLNPSDIETMDILKDASATAIYGSRGSNGVILITTKRGKAGKSNITFDAYYGVQTVEKIPKMKNSMDQAHWFYDGMKNKNIDAGNDISGNPLSWKQPVPQIIMDVLNGANTTDEEAMDYIFRSAPQQHYQISIDGGNDKVKYLVSGELTNQDGIVLNSNFERFSLRSNIDVQVTENLAIKLNLNPSYTQQVSLPVTGEGCCLGSNIVAAGLQIHNFYPPLNKDGSYFNYDGLTALAAVYNPVAVAELTQTLQSRSRLIGNINVEYKILNGLKFNFMLGGSVISGKGMRFRPLTPIFFNEPATGRDEAFLNYNWLAEYTLNYNKTIGLHNITGLAGYTTQRQKVSSNAMESNLYPNNLVPTLNAATGITMGTSDISEWSLISYLARFNYNYDGKYFLTASIRADGSSRFGADNRYALFPSVAGAWRISNEKFMKDIHKLSMLKFRASYGESGNNDIGNYQQYATIAYQKYVFGETPVAGFAPNQIANPMLTWEKQKQLNLGIDIGLFKDRVSFTTDYFHSTNSNLLLNVNVPSTTGFITALQNIGEVENSGWEFTVNTKNLSGKFVWDTNFNLSAYKNVVKKLGPSGDPIYSGNNITKIGQPIGMFYGYITDGVFMNQAELAKGPIYNPGLADRSRVGDIKFRDISGPNGVPDGKIDNLDNTIMGNPYPDFYYGMTNNFSYKRIALTISLQGSQGNDVLCVTRDAGYSGRSRVRGYAFTNDYWKSEAEPGDGKTFRPNDTPTGGSRRPNQNWIDNGSYLRITNMTLSYTLEEKIAKKLMVKNLRVYTTATNPFLFTKYISFNPDVSFRGDPLRPGNEANEYPLAKGLIFGLTASF